MGKANFLPGNRRKENKTSNSLHQHFLLDKFTTDPTAPLKYQHVKTKTEKITICQLLQHQTTKRYKMLEFKSMS